MNFKEKTESLSKNIKRLEKYVEMIEMKNKVMNLTGFSGDRLWQEGVYESIIALEDIKGKLLDIGAGAGFPSVPYKIHFEDIDLTIYEPIKKRTLFLEEVNSEMNLCIDIKNIRAEDSLEEEKYDYVTARAVAPLRVLVEIAHKPLKINGKMVFIKGPKIDQEIVEAKIIMEKLDLTYETKAVKIMDKTINIITITKNKKTRKGYPRPWPQIKKEI